MMRAMLAFAAVALLSTAASARSDRQAVPPAQPDGEAVSCIPLHTIRNTQVHGDKTIDFHMNGGKVYRNELPYACSSLGFEEKFSYKTSLNQLCSSDIITVLQTPMTGQGPSCGLGKFQPVKLIKPARH